MKTAKKALLLVLCGCLLVAASIIGTMAYFTDQEAVTNTFTIGKVGISLDEAVVDQYGVQQMDSNQKPMRTDEGNIYDATNKTGGYKIIPGHTYTKDPTVYVDGGSEPSYIRMFVEVTNYSNLKEFTPEGATAPVDVFGGANASKYYVGNVFLLQNLVGGWDNSVWEAQTNVNVTNNNTAIYEFRYVGNAHSANGIVDARITAENERLELEPLFTTFTIPGDVVTEENIGAFEDIQIKVTAQAIQADGFVEKDGKSAMQNAWDAFDAQRNN